MADKKRILVADDEPNLLDMIVDFCDDIGVEALRELMNGPNKTYRDYKNSMAMINAGTHVLRALGVQKAIIR